MQSTEAPVVPEANGSLSQLGAGIGLLNGAGAGPAPPPPAIGGHLEPLQLVASTRPVYPASARAQGVQGEVRLEVLVDETGKVVETTVLSGHPLLLDAAKTAVQNWKYQPARLNGKAISMRTTVSLRFDLN